MPIPAGQLVKNQTLLTISLGTKLDDALKVMIKHDFSQLPVIDKIGKPLGIVTGDSIARALLRFSGAAIEDLHIDDAIIKLPTITVDEDLLYIIDNLLKASAVLLTDGQGLLVNILTAYDTTQYFRKRAEDIVLLEDIENTLKSHIKSVYTPEELEEAIKNLIGSWDDVRKRGESSLRALCKDNSIPHDQNYINGRVDKFFPLKEKKTRDIDNLSLEEFIQLAEKAWLKLEPSFGKGKKKKESWSKMMREVRDIRNDIFHFRGEASTEERHSLRFCADWYAVHQPIQVDPVNIDSDNIDDVSASDLDLDNKTIIESISSETPNKSSAHTIRAIDFYSMLKNSINLIELKTNVSIENKYAPFIQFLTNDISDNSNVFDTTIESIESLIKQPLPKAAKEHSSWWLDYSSQSREWLLAGWRVESVSLNSNRVRFYRWSHLIDASDLNNVNYWAGKFNCTNQEILDAIKQLGRSLSTEVENFIKNKKS